MRSDNETGRLTEGEGSGAGGTIEDGTTALGEQEHQKDSKSRERNNCMRRTGASAAGIHIT